MIKIKISFEHPEEITAIREALNGKMYIKGYKTKLAENGEPYHRLYISGTLRETDCTNKKDVV